MRRCWPANVQVSCEAARTSVLRGGIRLLISLALAGASTVEANAVEPPTITTEATEFFEKEIRPLLVESCLDCHGPREQHGGLRLDSLSGAIKGGDSGPAVVPRRPNESELLRRIAERDDELRMPPADAGGRLTARNIEALRRWISDGAAWPVPADGAATLPTGGRDHWAFQPVRRTSPPELGSTRSYRTPIDRFILHELEANGLGLSPPADRRTLIRRAAYDLTGLPPTSEDVEDFVSDDSVDAYERLIDRLLASPHYGEHWGRKWLDVARYSDTKGYVYAREERFFVHASNYRDWVVEATNHDLPYDRFLLLQLAADQANDAKPRDLAAMGFLTLGRRFLGVTPDIMDDRIDVVTRGLMGLTVSCARCHDHKYDPIPTADYYSLYGVFRSCVEKTVAIPRSDRAPVPTPEFVAELNKRERTLAEALARHRDEAAGRVREHLADYLHAQRELDRYPAEGFDVVLSKDDLIPASLRRWSAFLADAAKTQDHVFLPWFAFAELDDDEFPAGAIEVARQLASTDASLHVNPRIRQAFDEPPASPRDVADRYGQVFSEIDRQWQTLREAAAREQLPAPQSLSDPADEQLRQVLLGPQSPCVIPDEPLVNIEFFFDSQAVVELWRLQGEVDRWLLQAPESAPHAVILADREQPVTPRIFRRGNAATPGKEVPRRFLKAISGDDSPPFSKGSGRLEFAEAIIAPDNPLTARVWVNRVWRHHFGEGLVRTPSDFGLRAEAPTHPELLDWLAMRIIANGWSTKALHRQIMLSEVYRQSSTGAADPAQRHRAQQIDAENKLLWRMNVRRLGFEEIRDSLLAASAELDGTMGGKPAEALSAATYGLRRSLYGVVDRQFLPGVLRIFDFANPDLHSPQRSETTVPQQALFALNHPFVASRARTLAQRIADEPGNSTADVRLNRLFAAVFQREPTRPQRDAALAFLASADAESSQPAAPAGASAWSYGYGELDADTGRLKSFHPLPHFTGAAWQGGPQWPDASLGWVQLTAKGGHAGNDLAHAAVRRWTAPRDLKVSVRSLAIHDVPAGDGIRCRILSNRHGQLASVLVHNERRQLEMDAIEVHTGDTLDFVVDYNANLNNDQFLWTPHIRVITPEDDTSTPVEWNAESDFVGPREALLDPWEQLAQALLVSNELFFAD